MLPEEPLIAPWLCREVLLKRPMKISPVWYKKDLGRVEGVFYVIFIRFFLLISQQDFLLFNGESMIGRLGPNKGPHLSYSFEKKMNFALSDEDRKSETSVYSFQEIEKMLYA